MVHRALDGLGGPLASSAFLVLPPSPALDDAEHPQVDRRRRRPHSFGRLILALCRRRARRQQRRCHALSDFGPVPCLCVPFHSIQPITCFDFRSSSRWGIQSYHLGSLGELHFLSFLSSLFCNLPIIPWSIALIWRYDASLSHVACGESTHGVLDVIPLFPCRWHRWLCRRKTSL